MALASTTCLALPSWARSGSTHGQFNGTHAGWSRGPQILSGDVTFARSGGNLVIDVLTPDAVVAFSRLKLRQDASITIDQTGPGSLFLGEVLHGPTLVLGTITANGQVALIDPAGITVGPGAQISAAGLLLSTAGLSASTLANLSGAAAAGHLDFGVAGEVGAGVANHGKIHVSSGSAILAGETVANDGLIVAEAGAVVLAGAKTYAVDFAGDGLLRFAAITGAVDAAPPGTAALVDNRGTLSAPGGRVLMTAQAAKGVLDNVINTSGIVEATSVASINGTIVLAAAGGGTVVSGLLDASGKGTGESGGMVEIRGDQVTLAATARVDVSGDIGGGTALIGGDFHGAGPLPNAQTTTVSRGAVISADALTMGDGGQVAVWSDGATTFNGAITARGGAQGGNGGFVETSGAISVAVATGSVDTLAPSGTTGTWLLDPTDILVAANTPGAIDPGALGQSTSDVVLQATGDVTFNSPVTMVRTGLAITVKAGDTITVGPAATISTVGGNITLSANDPDSDPSGSGSIVIQSDLLTANFLIGLGRGGAVSLSVNGGTGAVFLGSVVQTLAGNVMVNAPIVLTANGIIFTTIVGEDQGGSITLRGPVDSSSPGNYQLALEADGAAITTLGDIGARAALGTVSVSGSAVNIGGSVYTSGWQSYGGTTVLLSGSVYHADGLFQVSGPATFTAPQMRVYGSDIEFCCTPSGGGSIDGPGALVLSAGPAGSSNDVVGLYSLPSAGNVVLGTVGATVPLASLNVNAAGSIAIGNVTTTGAQSYTDQKLYLTGTAYQTSGATITQTGATILGAPPPPPPDNNDGGGGGVTVDFAIIVATPVIILPDPTIDTTGGGARPAGAAITMGAVDGDETFTVTAGTGGAVTLGEIGGTTPLGAVTIEGGRITLSGDLIAASATLRATGSTTGVVVSITPIEAADANMTGIRDTLATPAPDATITTAAVTALDSQPANAPALLTIIPASLFDLEGPSGGNSP